MAYYKSGGINVTSNSNVSINTASGSIASFNTNLSMPVLETKATINPVQNGTPWIDSNVVNKEPYIKRAVVGTASRIGNHLYDKLVGAAVAWNQILPNSIESGTYADVTITANGDGSITLNGTSTGRAMIKDFSGLVPIVGHIYLLVNGLYLTLHSSSWGLSVDRTRAINIAECTQIQSPTADTMRLEIMQAGYEFNNTVVYPQLIDLTAMFGSTIANYIYNLEQTTTGAGVAWFRNLFPNDYYAYNAGELMSVKATAHVMKDANNNVIGNYALDSNLTLNGLFKLDTNNKLYADGDTYESSGLVTRRYMLVNLGTTSWSFLTTANNVYLFIAEIPNIVSTPASNYIIKAITNNPKISIGAQSTWTSSMYQLSGYNSGANAILFTFNNDSASDVADFMNGTYMICEVETPTTEQASPFTNPQVCDENGTEEYTDSRAVAIPVGHETYQANICPISGFDELNIQQAGENLFDKTNANQIINAYISTNLLSNNKCRTVVARCKPSTVYTVSKTAGARFTVGWTETYPQIGDAIQLRMSNNTASSITITTGATANYIVAFIYNSDYDTITPEEMLASVQIAEGTDTTYHPYSGKLIQFDFDDTVYIAEVSCLNGVWKLKLLGAEVDLGNLTPDKYTVTEGNLFRYSLEDIKMVATNYDVTQALCSHYPSVAYSSRANNTMSQAAALHRIDIIDNRYSDATAFKNAMSGVKLIYPLATPTEITLDETDIFNALLGTNNVWHDGNGNTEVKYRKVNTQ